MQVGSVGAWQAKCDLEFGWHGKEKEARGGSLGRAAAE